MLKSGLLGGSLDLKLDFPKLQELDVLQAIHEEATFYGMPELVEKCSDHIAVCDRVIAISVGGIEYQVCTASFI